jgi:hypothetical protein
VVRLRIEKGRRKDDFLREAILHGLVCLEKIMELSSLSFYGYRFFFSMSESQVSERALLCRPLPSPIRSLSLSLALVLPSFENVKKLKNECREDGIKSE